jgi:peptidoglycan LD-endopeptidase CwlK
VTNARAGFSNHNFGIAWDVGIFNEKSEYLDDLIDKKMMTSKAVDAGLMERLVVFSGVAIGPTRTDPHFQMRDNDELASIRDTFTAAWAIV